MSLTTCTGICKCSLVVCGASREMIWMFWLKFRALQLRTEVWEFTSANYLYCWCACWVEYSIQRYLSNFLMPQATYRVSLFLQTTFINLLQLAEPFGHSWRHNLSLEYVKRINSNLSVCAKLLQSKTSIKSSTNKIMRKKNIKEKNFILLSRIYSKADPVTHTVKGVGLRLLAY